MSKTENTKSQEFTMEDLLILREQYSELRKENYRSLMSREVLSLQECVDHLFRFCASEYRLPELLSIIDEAGLDGKDAFTLLGQIWPTCDGTWRHSAQIRELLNEFRSDAVHMMTSEEKKELRKLPEEITVYRGCYQNSIHGLSWSLCPDVAFDFTTYMKYRGIGKPHLLTGKVKRKYAVLKLEREELEIFSDLVEIIDYKIIHPSVPKPKGKSIKK